MIVVGALMGYAAVDRLHARESDQRLMDVQIRSSSEGQLLVSMPLTQGDDSIVEVCDAQGFSSSVWRGNPSFVVIYREAGVQVASLTLERARHRRNRVSGRSCITVADAQSVPTTGTFDLRVTWQSPEPDAVGVFAVRARSFPSESGGSPLWLWIVLLGNLTLLASLRQSDTSKPSSVNQAMQAALGQDEVALESFLRGDSLTTAAPTGKVRFLEGGLFRVVLGVLLMVGILQALGAVLRPGRLGVLEAGLCLALAEILVAVGLSLPTISVLRLERLRSARWWLLAAPFLGVGLQLLSGMLGPLFPATGESPIEAFVEWPSGVLAVAVVALVAPLAEEIFFRGFVFGWVSQRWNELGGFLVSVTLFTLAHAPQTWGAWSSLVAVLLVGVLTSGLRWVSGSTVAPTIAHLAYNLMIILPQF